MVIRRGYVEGLIRQPFKSLLYARLSSRKTKCILENDHSDDYYSKEGKFNRVRY